jgi:peptide/nickel transport system substrate-binding protein
MKKWLAMTALLAAAALTLTGCDSATSTLTPQIIEKIVKETVVVEIEKERPVPQTVLVEKPVTPTKLIGPKVLVIGQAQEPDSLYGLGTVMLAARHVQQAFMDGPIDARMYDYQPVILEGLPSLEKGSAALKKVQLKIGDRYVDAASGDIVTATKTLELDQLGVTFKLKTGLLWSDGKPLTAHDSAFGYFLACHPDTPVSKYACQRTISYTATDDQTAVWTGLPGFMDATYFVNFWTPYPKHVLGQIAPKDILRSEYARKPLGWGPYRVVEWIAGEHITLEKNPFYFRAKEGLPKVEKIIYRFVPDTNQLLAQLLAGEVDIITSDGMPLEQTPFLLQAEKNKLLTPFFQTGTTWEQISFNLKPADARAIFFADVRVRQAIAYGVDRQLMVDKILYGKSKVQNSYLPEEHPLYAPKDKIVTYPYNREKARQLLREAGWTINKDGWLEKGGALLEVTLQTSAGSRVREQITQLFQQQMNELGIKVKLDYLPSNVLTAQAPDGPLFGRRFDLAEFAWLTGVEPPGDIYTCVDIPSAENRWAGHNLTGWCNKRYDEAVNKAKSTLDKDEQKKYWAEAQQIFMQELPALPLFARLKVAAARPNVSGLIVDPTEDSEMWNIENFDVTR